MNRNIDEMSALGKALRDMAIFAANLTLEKVKAKIDTLDSPPDVIEYLTVKVKESLQNPVYMKSMEDEQEIYDKNWLDCQEAISMERYETDRECSWREWNNDRI